MMAGWGGVDGMVPERTQHIVAPKLQRQLIHPNRPAQGGTETAQFTEIP